jgi:hypothetical protein
VLVYTRLSVRFLLLPSAALFLAGCHSVPDGFPVPEQRKGAAAARPFGHFANMNDPRAANYFVADIGQLQGGLWRWTGKKPTLRYFLEETDGLSFVMDYTITGHTFRHTGPVTLTIALNGSVFDRLRCEKEGEAHYEKAVGAGWLNHNGVNEVSIEIDKMWVSPIDGAAFGFVLIRAGFRD